MIEHCLAQTQSAKGGAHIHPFDFPKLGAKQLESAAPRQEAVAADHEKGHAFAQELLDAISVVAFRRIERNQVRFQLIDELYRLRRIGPLVSNSNYNGHVFTLYGFSEGSVCLSIRL